MIELGNLGSGSATGAGSGNAGLFGVSASGVGTSSSFLGGSSVGVGSRSASESLFTGQAAATGNGFGQSFGK